MKRSIAFLLILICLLAGAVGAEYLYSKDIKHKADDITDRYRDMNTKEEYESCADEICRLLDHKKFTNRLFYSKDITDKIMSEAKKMRHLAGGDNIADAKAQFESVKYLFNSLYRFNASE